MKLGEIPASKIKDRLNTNGLILKIGPFSFRITSQISAIADGLLTLYTDYTVLEDSEFVDFSVAISEGAGTHRWYRRQAIFKFDGKEPFIPLPIAHAFPLLEWSMNWCIAMYAHQYLLLHSAVIEKNGLAAIMPAPPGSGKSTLCAGLVHRGWRLLSDELALISLTDASITPLGRPISLKNQSIDVIAKFVPGAIFSKVVHDTSKGSVSLLKVPSQHLARIGETAQPRWVIFPKYVADSAPQLTPRSKANSMLELGRNSFNYMVLGLKGFQTLSQVVDSSTCFDFQYSKLDDAVAAFDALADGSTV